MSTIKSPSVGFCTLDPVTIFPMDIVEPNEELPVAAKPVTVAPISPKLPALNINPVQIILM